MQSLLPRKLSNGSRRHFLLQVMLSHNLSTVGKVGCKHLLQGVRNCRWSGSHTSFKRRIGLLAAGHGFTLLAATALATLAALSCNQRTKSAWAAWRAARGATRMGETRGGNGE